MRTIIHSLHIALILVLLAPQQLKAQIVTTPADSTVKEKHRTKKKIIPAVEKGLLYLSYLNYSDRTVDRMRVGKEAYEPYQGKLIRHVQIKIFKPFGTSLDEPDTYRPNRAEKIANSAQITTREWVVGDELLFKEGDTLVPVLIAETERNLWNRDNFKDIRLLVNQVPGDSASVDITVMVRDRFSWSPYFVVQPDMVKAGVQFKNFMGIPQTLRLYGGPIYRTDNPYTLRGSYSYNNIKSTHIDLGCGFTYERLNKGGNLKISKPFYSPFNKWAWHVKGDFYKQGALVPNVFAAAIPSGVTYHSQEAWLAHSLPFSKRNEKTDLRRIIVSWHYKHYQYVSRPFIHNEDYSQYYTNSWYLLSGIGVANWDYYLDNNIYSLGEPEYFAKGWNSAFIYGVHHDEDVQTRLHLGLKINHGISFKNFGYWFSELSGSGYFTTEKTQQVNVAWHNSFFSAPLHIHKFVIRQFIKANVNFGFLQIPGHQILVNNESGDLRGFYYNTLQGERSYTFGYQMNVYPPFKLLGFTSCAFVFADLALVGQHASWSDNKFAQSIGFGIRVRHMALGLDFFEISFAYLPSLSLPGQRPMNVIANMERNKGIPRNDLFDAGIVSP